MGILGSVVQPLVLSMLRTLQHLFLCCCVTLEFIGDDYPWCKALFLQQFAKESFRRLRVSMPLQQDIQDVSFRVYCPPQIVLLFFDRHHDLIEMPFVGKIRSFAPYLISILLSEFLTPFPDGFVGHLNPPVQHHFLNVPVA